MNNPVLSEYTKLSGKPLDALEPGVLAFIASVASVAERSPEIARSIVGELRNQRSSLKMIASENYCSLATQNAMGNLLTDKYAEGKPYQRYYAGCDNVDAIEARAVEIAKDLFGADHAYVQPHSGADANMVAFYAILALKVEQPAVEKLGKQRSMQLTAEEWEQVRQEMGNQRLLAHDFAAGGHLTHGYRLNASGKMFEAFSYTVDKQTNRLDYDAIEKQAMEVKPLILLAGYSAYPRKVNFKRMREIADKVGAVLMVDMAHFAGLVAGKVFRGEYDPVAYADIVTSTTHKTLRGPRGGIVLCKEWLKDEVDKGCPLALGGPLPHVMAAKAVAFAEANTLDFRDYAQRVVDNAAAFADALQNAGISVLTGGTENHLVLVDVTNTGLTGYHAEFALREAGITLNRNAIPFDPQPPLITSGLRFGTAAVTSLGMGPGEMATIAGAIADVLKNTEPGTIEKDGERFPSKKAYATDPAAMERAQTTVRELIGGFAVYPGIDLEALTGAVNASQPVTA
jgi:glycine hydroxymethyltransferase